MKTITSLSGLYILACWVCCLCSCNSNVQNSQDTLLPKDITSPGAIQNKDTANVADTSVKADTVEAPVSFTIEPLKKGNENKIQNDCCGSDGTIYLKGKKTVIGKHILVNGTESACFRINGKVVVFKANQISQKKENVIFSNAYYAIEFKNNKIIHYDGEAAGGGSTINSTLLATDKQSGQVKSFPIQRVYNFTD